MKSPFLSTICFYMACLSCSAFISHCITPCEELADRICRCEDKFVIQNACRSLIAVDSKNTHPQDKDQQFCKERLKECSCQKLAAGDRAACGMNPVEE